MNRYLSELARSLKPYTPGEQPKDKKYVKLNTNESPYPPSPKVFDAILKYSNADLRLYPDPKSSVLLKAASKYYELPENMIFTGNGSDEVLAFAFAAFYFGKKIVFPEVTYSFYPVYCRLFNVEYKELPMEKSVKMNTQLMKDSGCGVVFPNPNAPTGQLFSLETIEEIVESNKENVVVVDEAYIDFGGKSSVGLTRKYDNLLVIQTFSKSRSLAGLRIGLAFGNTELIDGLNRVKDSFNSYPVDRLAQEAGAAALADDSYYKKMQEKIKDTRKTTISGMKARGFKVLESGANFIFASCEKMNAAEIYEKLKDNNILVRYFAKPGIDNFIRITIGTDEQMQILFQNLDKILEG